MNRTRYSDRNTSAPRLQPGFVDRPRLSDHARAMQRYRLVVVHAPAGSGKTSLLIQWAQAMRTDEVLIAWYSATENEGHHLHLADCLLLSVLRAISPDIGDPLILPDGEDPDARLLSTLVGLAAKNPSGRNRLTLFIDDFHLIEGDAEIRTLTRLLRDAPEGLTVVVSGRNRPALPLGRYRLRGELLELTTKELQFSAAEIQFFFRAAMGRELSSSETERLHSSTEGWAAGLRLTMLIDDAPGNTFLQYAPAGSQREYAEYFLDEVIAGLPDELCRFLEHTSVLEALTPELCDAVTGQAGSASTLSEIERAQLFLTELPGSRRWYKYHQLFQDFLQARLQTRDPERISELHLRATEWFIQANMPFDAVRHAFLANRPEQAAALIERYCTFDYLSYGRFETYSGWMAQLPRENREARPLLMLLMVWRYINLRQFLQAEQTLQKLEHSGRQGGCLWQIAESSGMNLAGRIDLMRALIGAYGGDLVSARDHIDRARETTLDNLPFGQVDLLSIHAYVAFNEGDLEQAERLTWRANTIYEEIDCHWGHIHSLCIAGMSYLARCRWEDAGRVLSSAIDVARRHFSDGSYMIALPSALLGALALNGGNHAQAETLLSAALPVADAAGVPGLWERKLVAILGLAQIYDRQGRANEATALLRRFRRAAIEEEDLRMEFRLNVEAADRAIRTGDAAAAQQPLGQVLRQRSEAETRFGPRAWQIWEPFGILMARAAAAGLVAQNADSILQGLASRATAESRNASALLCRAVASGIAPNDPCRGQLISDLEAAGLSTVLDELVAPGSRAHRQDERPTVTISPDFASANNLTPRESEVFALMRMGARNHEISEALGININTVKTHAKNIFSKLNVRSRIEAVMRA